MIDATRISDGKIVAIKRIEDNAFGETNHRREVDIMRFLSSDPLRLDPDNHCAELLDAFEHPSKPTSYFIVIPWLAGFTYVRPGTVGDVLEMLRQLIEVPSFRYISGWRI